jgi:hypothetical protein
MPEELVVLVLVEQALRTSTKRSGRPPALHAVWKDVQVVPLLMQLL